jgi:hypothetical protein
MHENANNAIPQRRRQAFGGRWIAIGSELMRPRSAVGKPLAADGWLSNLCGD